jgi:hypothetical protein
MTTLHDFGGVLGRPLDTFLGGSHNPMVTALGLCLKVALKSTVTIAVSLVDRSSGEVKEYPVGPARPGLAFLCFITLFPPHLQYAHIP